MKFHLINCQSSVALFVCLFLLLSPKINYCQALLVNEVIAKSILLATIIALTIIGFICRYIKKIALNKMWG